MVIVFLTTTAWFRCLVAEIAVSLLPKMCCAKMLAKAPSKKILHRVK
jgi:hypothetical protein